jgi:hypothetical protein
MMLKELKEKISSSSHYSVYCKEKETLETNKTFFLGGGTLIYLRIFVFRGVVLEPNIPRKLGDECTSLLHARYTSICLPASALMIKPS